MKGVFLEHFLRARRGVRKKHYVAILSNLLNMWSESAEFRAIPGFACGTDLRKGRF